MSKGFRCRSKDFPCTVYDYYFPLQGEAGPPGPAGPPVSTLTYCVTSKKHHTDTK